MMLKCCVYICSSILSDTNIGYKPLAVAWVTTSSFHITMGVTLLQTEARTECTETTVFFADNPNTFQISGGGYYF